jgi:hypothetical protein
MKGKKKSTLGKALAEAVGATVAKTVMLKAADYVALGMTAEAAAATVDFAAYSKDRKKKLDKDAATHTARVAAFADVAFAEKWPQPKWKPFIAKIRAADEYLSQCVRNAYKAKHGETPKSPKEAKKNKGKKTVKAGTKGVNGKRIADVIESQARTLVQTLTKYAKHADVDTGAMQRMAEAMASVLQMATEAKAKAGKKAA